MNCSRLHPFPWVDGISMSAPGRFSFGICRVICAPFPFRRVPSRMVLGRTSSGPVFLYPLRVLGINGSTFPVLRQDTFCVAPVIIFTISLSVIPKFQIIGILGILLGVSASPFPLMILRVGSPFLTLAFCYAPSTFTRAILGLWSVAQVCAANFANNGGLGGSGLLTGI